MLVLQTSTPSLVLDKHTLMPPSLLVMNRSGGTTILGLTLSNNTLQAALGAEPGHYYLKMACMGLMLTHMTLSKDKQQIAGLFLQKVKNQLKARGSRTYSSRAPIQLKASLV